MSELKKRVIQSLAHFKHRLHYGESDPYAVVVAGDLCLCFEVVPEGLRFFGRNVSYVRFSHAFHRADW